MGWSGEIDLIQREFGAIGALGLHRTIPGMNGGTVPLDDPRSSLMTGSPASLPANAPEQQA